MTQATLTTLIAMIAYTLGVWAAYRVKKAYRAKKRLRDNDYIVEFN